MSLLSICRAVAAEVGWPVPSQISGSLEATAVQLMALANAELRHLSEFHDWPHLESDYTFSLTPPNTVYAWPSDFRKQAFGSVFDEQQYFRLRGSMNVENWMARKYGLLGKLARMTFRTKYVNGVASLEFNPTPTENRNVVALYYSTNYAMSGATPIPVYAQDTDVSRIPERLVELGLKWRFRRAKGLDFSAELSEYNAVVNQQFVARQAPQDIPVGGSRYWDDGITPGYVPDTGFGP